MNGETVRKVVITVFVACMSIAAMIAAVGNAADLAPQTRHALGSTLIYPLAVSQVCLAAVWLAVGRYNFVSRLLVAAVTILLWSWINAGFNQVAFEQTRYLFTLTTLYVVTTLLIARILDYQLWRFTDELVHSPLPHRFSLREVFGWVLAAALVMLAIRDQLRPLRWGLHFATYSVHSACACLMVTWAIFNQRHIFSRLLCALVISLSITAGISYWQHTLGDRFDIIWAYVKLNAIICCIIAVLLLPFRRLGYRWTRSGVFAKPALS